MQNKPLKLLHRNHVCREYWKLFDETFLSIEVFLPFLHNSHFYSTNLLLIEPNQKWITISPLISIAASIQIHNLKAHHKKLYEILFCIRMVMFLNVSVNSITWLYVLMKYYFRLGNNTLCPSKSGDIVRIMSERERKSACTLFCKSQVPRKCFVLSSISLFHNNELRISAVFYERECPNLTIQAKPWSIKGVSQYLISTQKLNAFLILMLGKI